MIAKMSLWGMVLTVGSGLAFGADISPAVGPALPVAIEKSNSAKVNVMKIRITVEGKTLRATLADTPSARDFAALLPLTIPLEDYARTEKIHYLPKKLSADGAPSGMVPARGDIAYYAPWGNLAIFYKDFGYSSGLIRLGNIESGVEILDVAGSLTARIERISE